ncbi:zinc ABC transporter substrate-binding protein, partial [Candidatus Atribacteria bacterium HGW-Atribacteria-1]
MDQKIKFIWIIGLAFLIAVLVLISGCVEEKPKQNLTQEKIIVEVTISPQAEFVEKVGGDKVKIIVMVPPGASPHTYEPTPNQMIDLNNAKMYAKVGSGVEFELGWMDKITDLNKNMLVVDCSKGIEQRKMTEEEEKAEEDGHESGEEHEHEEGGNDPHIWLSPKNAKMMVENIYNGLIEIDPDNTEYYKTNKNSYIAELDKADGEISKKLLNLKNRKILVFHSSWGYFCRDYNLTQIAIEKSGKEPTLQGIENLIKQAKENNITIIFTSPQFSTK